MKENRVLTIDNLTTTFESHKQKIQAVRGVSLHVDEGDILAIVGESGSGKSVTMKSVMGLLGENADVQADHLELLQKDLLSMSEKEKRKMRGKDMAMIFQDPMTALNPLKKIGYHMIEVLRRHQNLSKAEARKVAIDMLGKVGIPSAESRMDQYPHEFSGARYGHMITDEFLLRVRGIPVEAFKKSLKLEVGREFPVEKFRNDFKSIVWQNIRQYGMPVQKLATLILFINLHPLPR